MLAAGGGSVEDMRAHGENEQEWAREWFPHRLTFPAGESSPGADALAMWELIVNDFLATLPLED